MAHCAATDATQSCALEDGDDRAAAVAERFGLALARAPQTRFLLRFRDDRMELLDRARPRLKPWSVDFTAGAVLRRLRQGDPLLRRAARIAPEARRGGLQCAIDATAGAAVDALLLARCGYRVTAFERHPAVAALLEDGLRRALASDELRPWVARIHLRWADAHQALSGLVCAAQRHSAAALPGAAAQAPELPRLVFLDPMFAPGRRALPGRTMQLFAALVGTDPDAGALLEAARRCALGRVVVKRQRSAAALGPGASYSVRGRQIRYDIYLPVGR